MHVSYYRLISKHHNSHIQTIYRTLLSKPQKRKNAFSQETKMAVPPPCTLPPSPNIDKLLYKQILHVYISMGVSREQTCISMQHSMYNYLHELYIKKKKFLENKCYFGC